MEKKRTPNRLSIVIEKEDHMLIKSFAAQKGIRLQEWVIQALKKYAEEQELERLLKINKEKHETPKI